jgi:predicted nucleic acid-binding protein
MANRKVFFDANILLYTDDPRYPDRQRVALDLLDTHLREKTGAVSTQVLQEYFANATRKLRIDASLARQKTVIFSQFQVLQPTTDDILAAIDLHRLHQIAFWDAMIVRMAVLSGASILYTEDLQDRRRIDSLQIVNPFQS